MPLTLRFFNEIKENKKINRTDALLYQNIVFSLVDKASVKHFISKKF